MRKGFERDIASEGSILRAVLCLGILITQLFRWDAIKVIGHQARYRKRRLLSVLGSVSRKIILTHQNTQAAGSKEV